MQTETHDKEELNEAQKHKYMQFLSTVFLRKKRELNVKSFPGVARTQSTENEARYLNFSFLFFGE
jgi:hypothetical protein